MSDSNGFDVFALVEVLEEKIEYLRFLMKTSTKDEMKDLTWSPQWNRLENAETRVRNPVHNKV